MRVIQFHAENAEIHQLRELRGSACDKMDSPDKPGHDGLVMNRGAFYSFAGTSTPMAFAT